jgi:methionyl aminopeptidase
MRLTEDALRAYDAAGMIVKKVKGGLRARAGTGAKLLDLAEFAEGEIARLGGKPAFPCNISINEIASHSTPHVDDRRTLQRGDLVKFDLGATVDGFIADSAFTIEVGTASYSPLIAAAEQALTDAITAVKPGVQTGEIGGIIEASARSNGFSVLKGLYGHNLEHDCLHGGLTIPNYDDGSRKKVREGDVIAIEPFLTGGDGEIVRLGGGDIFQLIRHNAFFLGEPEKKLLSHIERNYNGFPFARRWLPDLDAGDPPAAIDRLVGASIAIEYPMLVEKDGAAVAQAEHTVIVGRDGGRIIT